MDHRDPHIKSEIQFEGKKNHISYTDACILHSLSIIKIVHDRKQISTISEDEEISRNTISDRMMNSNINFRDYFPILTIIPVDETTLFSVGSGKFSLLYLYRQRLYFK